MATEAQIQVFTDACCGGAGSCLAVDFATDPPAVYNFPLSELQSTNRIQRTQAFIGDPPFNITSFGVTLPDVIPPLFVFSMEMTGNIAVMSVDSGLPILVTSAPLAFTYTVSNCNGASVTYNGLMAIIP